VIFGKRKRRGGEGTTILFASDLHGSTTCFKKVLNAPAFYGQRGRPVDALVLGGDMTGKLIVPIIDEGGAWRSYLHGREHRLETDHERAGFVRTCETLGVYQKVFSPEEYRAFQEDEALQGRIFDELMLTRLHEWLELAEERLAGQELFCSMMPGNDDIAEVDALLAQSERIENADGAVLRLGDEHEMIGVGVSNPTPFHCPRDVPEEEVRRRIDELVARVSDLTRCVFNVHVPPHGTGIDEAPVLDDELRPQVGPEGVEMAPVGSVAVREAIVQHQPLLGLHGHIHESKGTATLGRTLCVNPGSEYSDGVLRAALVTLQGDRVTASMLVSG
jgi:uncharacterized protein